MFYFGIFDNEHLSRMAPSIVVWQSLINLVCRFLIITGQDFGINVIFLYGRNIFKEHPKT